MNVETALELINQVLFAKTGRYLRPPEITIIEGIWQGLTYAQMAEASSYSTNYLMRDIGPKFWRQISDVLGEPTSKTNLRVVIDRLSRTAQSPLLVTAVSNLQASNSSLLPRTVAIAPSSPSVVSPLSYSSERQSTVIPVMLPAQDWYTQLSEPTVSTTVYGRMKECQQLTDWITRSACRVVGIGGIGGVGKTSLLRTVASQLQDRFEVIQWRSLKQGPTVADVVLSLQESRASVSIKSAHWDAIAQLLEYLCAKPTLLILDDIEGVLSTDRFAGQTQNGHQAYDQLLQRLSTADHSSCVMIAGTELPRSLLRLQDQTTQVQSFILDGLPQSDAIQLLAVEQLEDAASWPLLIDYYQGHPLALKLAAKLTRELFHGHLSELWEQKLCLLDEINTVFERSIKRLSFLEQDILYLLATNSQALSLTEIKPQLSQPSSVMQLVEALESLKQRSLLMTLQHSGQSAFTLSPILKDSVRHYLIKQVGKTGTGPVQPSTPLSSLGPSLRLTPTIQQPICLRDWVNGKFPPAWQAITHLFSHRPGLALRLRSTYQLRDESVIKRFKQVRLGPQEHLTDDSVILLVAIHPEPDQSLKICIQAQPAPQQATLPAGLSMRLLNLEGVPLAQVDGADQDSFIQLPYFNGVAQERFTIQLGLSDQHYNEDFVI